MKNYLLIAALATTLAACQNSFNSADLSGTYVNQSQSEYSIANDTLVIEAAKNTENIYLVTRNTGYRRITDGRLGPARYLHKRFTGTWDPAGQTLQLMQTGTLLIFQPDQNKVLIGTNAYWKL